MSFPVDGRLAAAWALAVALCLSAQTPALAQLQHMLSQRADAEDSHEEAAGSDVGDFALDPHMYWSVLDVDAAALANLSARATAAPLASGVQGGATQWNRTERRDGSAAITAKRQLPTVWDTRVGIDLNVAPQPSPIETPDRLLAATSSDRPGGAAWASTTAPALNLPIGWDKASIDARLDPSQEQGKLGSRVSKSVPLNDQLSVTMESGFAVTHLRTQPLPSELSGGHATTIYDTERLAKLSILGTGTTLAAGTKKSTADDIWLNSLSAEQKLPGGLSITGTFSETREGDTSKSLTAGFKRTW